jgi:hypothetical protein
MMTETTETRMNEEEEEKKKKSMMMMMMSMKFSCVWEAELLA